MTWTVQLEADPGPSVRDAILHVLNSHNEAVFRPSEGTALAITVRNETGAIAGGLWGAVWHCFLFVQYLATGEAKGQGIGRQVMALAEAEALRRGCTGIWLDTLTWQAPWFYPKLGFEEFGRIKGYVADQDRIFLVKRLPAPDGTTPDASSAGSKLLPFPGAGEGEGDCHL